MVAYHEVAPKIHIKDEGCVLRSPLFFCSSRKVVGLKAMGGSAIANLDALGSPATLKRSGFGDTGRSGAEKRTRLRHWTLHCRLQTLDCELFVVMVSVVSLVSVVRMVRL